MGTDPYEGLNATRFAAPFRGSVTGRKILIQAVKRSPIDLRPMLEYPRDEARPGLPHWCRRTRFGRKTTSYETRSTSSRASAARTSPSPAGVTTSMCRRASSSIRAARRTRSRRRSPEPRYSTRYERTGDEALLEQAVGAGEFFLRHVPQTTRRDGRVLRLSRRRPYADPQRERPRLRAARTRGATHAGRDDFLQAADAGVAYTLAHQEPDGSWPYGGEPHLRWVDGFHTGYVLDALRDVRRVRASAVHAGRRSTVASRSIAGRSSSTTERRSTRPDRPTRSTSSASRRGSRPLPSAGDPWALTVYRFALQHMRRPDGAFAFQRRRFWRNDAPHVRWGQAPMLLALTHLLGATIMPA